MNRINLAYMKRYVVFRLASMASLDLWPGDMVLYVGPGQTTAYKVNRSGALEEV